MDIIRKGQDLTSYMLSLVSKPILQTKWLGERIDKSIIRTTKKKTLTLCGCNPKAKKTLTKCG